MAELDKKLVIEVTPKIRIERKDAMVCLNLLNLFLSNNEEYRLVYDAIENEARLVSDDG